MGGVDAEVSGAAAGLPEPAVRSDVLLCRAAPLVPDTTDTLACRLKLTPAARAMLR
jgi:hypothetical protein